MRKFFTSLAGFFFLVGTAGAGIFNVGVVQAAGDTCTSLTAADFSGIKTIENNPGLSSTQELTQELALRKQLLSQTITCATQDAQALQATLNSIDATGNAATIQSSLSAQIDNAISFYDIESAKVDGAGIRATIAIAEEMLAWRAANYDPLEQQVNNLALWSSNQTLFNTAANRLAQTGHVVALIQNAAPNADLAAQFGDVQSSFNAAEVLNTAAGSAFAQNQPPDQTLAIIQQSLQSLSDTYQKFTDLNTLIQGLLPTTQQ